MPFGAEIKRLREDAKISVDKLAAKIGVNAGRWRKWEEKDLNPRIEDCTKIEAYFKMDLEQIMKLPSIKKFLIVPHEKTEAQDVNPEYRTKSTSDVSTISTLAQSNLNLSESNKSIARSHEQLVSMLKEKEPATNSEKLTMAEMVATVAALREFVIDLVAGLKHQSPTESRRVLRKMVKDQLSKAGSKDIQTDHHR